MCAFTAVALAGGAAGIGTGATLTTTGLLAGSSLGAALMSDVGLITSGFSAMSSMGQSDNQASVYEYQAATEATNQALREDDRLRAMRRNTSTQLAQFGALGVDPLSGSAPLAIAETAQNTSYDIFNDQFSSQTEIETFNASARNTRSAGRSKATGTLIGGVMKSAERYA